MAHAHGHAHATTPVRASPRVRRGLLIAVVPIVLATFAGLVALWPHDGALDLSGVLGSASTVKGTVVDVRSSTCAVVGEDVGDLAGIGDDVGPGGGCDRITVRLTSGDHSGARVAFENPVDGGAAIERGDRLVLAEPPARGVPYAFADFQRDRPIALLVVLFAAATVVLARWRGVRALLALGVTLVVIVRFVLPSIVEGHSPVAVSLVGSAALMLVVLYLTGGVNVRTTIAVLGTMASLGLIALLAAVFVAASQFTGVSSEEASFVRAAASDIDLRGLLLGGIVIGSLGVLDDMTVTQTSAVWELHGANPALGPRELFASAMRIGRDHIGSTVNTLVLAYAGAVLPLLILFTTSQQALTTVLTSEVVATEVVRTLVGSIGLVASVPITTGLAAFIVTRSVPPRRDETAPAVAR